MNCTHPVLYSRNGELYCHICGAVLPLETLTKPKDEPKPAERPPEAKKRTRRREEKSTNG